MNKIFFLKKEEANNNWKQIDAKGLVLGRMATRIADMLRGKDRSFFTPHSDSGSYVVVINAQDVVLTGNKKETKIYDRYSGWMGGYKTKTAGQMLESNPEEMVMLAVRRMLPKNKLSRQLIRKLRVYRGSEHPHQAQLGKSA